MKQIIILIAFLFMFGCATSGDKAKGYRQGDISVVCLAPCTVTVKVETSVAADVKKDQCQHMGPCGDH